jgi:hypothetical protein
VATSKEARRRNDTMQGAIGWFAEVLRASGGLRTSVQTIFFTIPHAHAFAVAAGFELIAAGGVSVTCQFDSLK